jgi:hypothetical protein
MSTGNQNLNDDRNGGIHTPGSDADSFEIAGGKGQKPSWRKIDVQAPYHGADSAFISIEVRELRGKELGALASPDFEKHAERAIERKSQEDKASYNRTTLELEQESRKKGYFDSPPHRAWAEAAEARTGGRLSSEWWMKFDPYGGTNGNGPNIMLDGSYPGSSSRIGMAHDTDWSLGRHFQAGPLRALYGADAKSHNLGLYGLSPTSDLKPAVADLYTVNGHSHWRVGYHHKEQIPFSAQGGDNPDQTPKTVVATALVENNPDLNRQFLQALKGSHHDRDTAALAVQTISQAPGYNPNADISVIQGKNGGLIVSQGDGPTAINLPVTKAQPGDFERVSQQLTQTPVQTAAQPEQPERVKTQGV